MDVVGDPDDDDRQHALGGVVLESAYLEHLLRAVFTALLGSKYGAVVAASRNAGWLTEQCQPMARTRQEIPPDGTDALFEALAACSDACQRRNRVVHDARARRDGGLAVTLRSHRSKADMTVTARTVPELDALADDLASAADSLAAAATAALGAECLQLENQLRLELGHDIGADTGRP